MRTGLMAAPVLVVTVLAAASCGTTTAGQFHPAGSADAPSSPSATPTVTLATFPFPSSVHITFETPLPSDPKQAAAVTTDEDYQLAYYYAIYSAGKDGHFESYVYSGARELLASASSSVFKYGADGFTGTIRFYNTAVQSATASDITVTSCVNNTQLLSTDRRTGKIIPGQGTSPGQHVFLESDTLAPVSGSWKLVAIAVAYYPKGTAKECYP
jgi:hypothetical protein